MAGKPVPRLSEPVQHRLLRAAIDSLCDEGALLHYAPLRDKPGFVRRLRELILELKQARVTPEDFASALVGEPRRLSELAAIYQRYQDWLQDTGWADAEGQGWLAAIALENHPALGSNIRLLAVDGFDEFNPTQLAVLNLLAQVADETIVTLTGENDEIPRDAHRRFTRARADLCRACPDIEIHPIPAIPSDRAPVLTHLESSLFTRQTSPANPQSLISNTQSPITLLEARNRAEETRAALRWLKERIVRQGIAPHDTAILVRNIEPYRPFLAEVAAEYGLPIHISGGEELSANPAIAALLNLMSLPVLDWPQRAVLDAWRSPYFDWSALLEEAGESFKSIKQAASRLDEDGARGPNHRRAGAVARGAGAARQISAESSEDRAKLEGPVGEEAAALLAHVRCFCQRTASA